MRHGAGDGENGLVLMVAIVIMMVVVVVVLLLLMMMMITVTMIDGDGDDNGGGRGDGKDDDDVNGNDTVRHGYHRRSCQLTRNDVTVKIVVVSMLTMIAMTMIVGMAAAIAELLNRTMVRGDNSATIHHTIICDRVRVFAPSSITTPQKGINAIVQELEFHNVPHSI